MSSDPNFYDFFGLGNSSSATSSEPKGHEFPHSSWGSERTYHDFLGVDSSSTSSSSIQNKHYKKILNQYDAERSLRLPANFVKDVILQGLGVELKENMTLNLAVFKCDEGKKFTLSLRKYRTTGYELGGGWVKHFAGKKRLQEGDWIDMCWDDANKRLNLKRA